MSVRRKQAALRRIEKLKKSRRISTLPARGHLGLLQNELRPSKPQDFSSRARLRESLSIRSGIHVKDHLEDINVSISTFFDSIDVEGTGVVATEQVEALTRYGVSANQSHVIVNNISLMQENLETSDGQCITRIHSSGDELRQSRRRSWHFQQQTRAVTLPGGEKKTAKKYAEELALVIRSRSAGSEDYVDALSMFAMGGKSVSLNGFLDGIKALRFQMPHRTRLQCSSSGRQCRWGS